MIQILKSAYPPPAARSKNFVIALLFGAFISFFLIFFEPFEIDVASGKNSLGSLIFYGCITSAVLTVFTVLLPPTFPRLFSEKRWKVGHQISFCFLILLVIATLNGLYTNYLNDLPFSWTNYWWIIKNTVVLGCIPFSFLILIDYQKRQVTNSRTAQAIKPETDQKKQNAPIQKVITTDLKDETFAFDDTNFTHASAEGNYVDLYFHELSPASRRTYRLSLSSLEVQLDADHLVRCHRSYLVNLRKVVSVTGNAQGLKLKLRDSEATVSVSRKYIPLIKSYFNGQKQ